MKETLTTKDPCTGSSWDQIVLCVWPKSEKYTTSNLAPIFGPHRIGTMTFQPWSEIKVVPEFTLKRNHSEDTTPEKKIKLDRPGKSSRA